MDPRLSVWPEESEPEPRTETAELLRLIDREIAADLRAAGDRSAWSEMISEVFDRVAPVRRR